MAELRGREAQANEYDVVRLRPSWGVLSLLTVPLMLSAHLVLRYLPWRPQRIWTWPLVYVLVVLGLAAVGLAAGLLGMRYSPRKTAARFGALINGAILALTVLTFLGMVYVRYLR